MEKQLNKTYIKDGYVCNCTEYNHTCEYCGSDYISTKAKQKFCSNECRHLANKLWKPHNAIDDPSFFNNCIDSELKAYVFGLIMSDGSISCDKISISMNDKELMEIVHDVMTPMKKLYKNGKSYSVISNNKDDLNYLKSLGVTTNKSYDAELIQLDNKLMSHFVRGWFDGDGCVYQSTTTNKKLGYSKIYTYVSFTSGSYKFVEQLKKFLENINIESKIVKDKRNNNWYVKITKVDMVNKFYDYIYSNSKYKLDRKYHKFMR